MYNCLFNKLYFWPHFCEPISLHWITNRYYLFSFLNYNIQIWQFKWRHIFFINSQQLLMQCYCLSFLTLRHMIQVRWQLGQLLSVLSLRNDQRLGPHQYSPEHSRMLHQICAEPISDVSLDRDWEMHLSGITEHAGTSCDIQITFCPFLYIYKFLSHAPLGLRSCPLHRSHVCEMYEYVHI